MSEDEQREQVRQMGRIAEMVGAAHDQLDQHAEDHDAFMALTLLEKALGLLEDSVKHQRELLVEMMGENK